MPCNALFQLGMGSARLNASQKEDAFGTRALRMSAKVLSHPGRRPRPATPLRRVEKPLGNSAKARIRTGSAGTPPRS